MLMFASTPSASVSPTPQQIADLRLAASHMSGATRRAFQAEMALKYCDGNPRRAEAVFGWGRQNIEVGLAEKRTGIVCLRASIMGSATLHTRHLSNRRVIAG